MSDCNFHALTFGSDQIWPMQYDVHDVSGTSAGVADFACPNCGLMLHVYYRVVPAGSSCNERQKERDEK